MSPGLEEANVGIAIHKKELPGKIGKREWQHAIPF
jgi:hypothetical protein